jgi:hypothetical protein
MVVACAQTKTLPVPPELELGRVPAAIVSARAHAWVEKRDAACAAELPALDLYSGTYWATIRRLKDTAVVLGYETRLWVASAGYGLVPDNASLKPYSATFAAGDADSVCNKSYSRGARATVLRDWWTIISGDRGVASVATADRRGSLLIVAGPAYVNAMWHDLSRAAAALASLEQLVIVSSRESAAPPILRSNVVRSEARLAHAVGGALPVLHARVTEKVLEVANGKPLQAGLLRTHFARVLARQPEWQLPVREKSADEEVRAFVRRELRSNPALSYTAALRTYRGTGRACEQKRFKTLFGSVTEESDAR